jgi:hypothetical protein
MVRFHTIYLYFVARRAQMPPLPTPRSSARWLAYERVDPEGIWNATMIVVSGGHLLARKLHLMLCLVGLFFFAISSSDPPHTKYPGLECNTHVSPKLSNIKHHIPDRTNNVPQTEPPGPHFYLRGMCLRCGWWKERCTCGPGIRFHML